MKPNPGKDKAKVKERVKKAVRSGSGGEKTRKRSLGTSKVSERKRKDVPVPPKQKGGARVRKMSVWSMEAPEELCPGPSQRVRRSTRVAKAKVRDDMPPTPTKCQSCPMVYPTVKELDSHRAKCCKESGVIAKPKEIKNALN